MSLPRGLLLLRRRRIKARSAPFIRTSSSSSSAVRMMAESHDVESRLQDEPDSNRPAAAPAPRPKKKKDESNRAAVCIAVVGIMFLLGVLVGTELLGLYVAKSGITYQFMSMMNKVPNKNVVGANENTNTAKMAAVKLPKIPEDPSTLTQAPAADQANAQIESPDAAAAAAAADEDGLLVSVIVDPLPTPPLEITGDQRTFFIDDDGKQQTGFVDGMAEMLQDDSDDGKTGQDGEPLHGLHEADDGIDDETVAEYVGDAVINVDE